MKAKEKVVEKLIPPHLNLYFKKLKLDEMEGFISKMVAHKYFYVA